MAVPKKKTSKSKRNMRRSHHAMSSPFNVRACAQCGEPSLMHHVCKACGFYQGREVIEIPID